MWRGQALIEFALVLPLLLFLLLGTIAVGLFMVASVQLQHAVGESAVHAAQTDCDAAERQIDRLLGRPLLTYSCQTSGGFIEVVAVRSFPAIFPPLPDTIQATGRAVVRKHEPAPTPTPVP